MGPSRTVPPTAPPTRRETPWPAALRRPGAPPRNVARHAGQVLKVRRYRQGCRVRVKEGLEEACNHHVGDFFERVGENVRIPVDRTFSMYAMAAVLPLLPTKQRRTDPDDGMTTDDLVTCRDPNRDAVMKITRIGVRDFDRADVTVEP